MTVAEGQGARAVRAEGEDLRSEFARLVRARIKAGAIACFARYGYRGATIRQIAQAAGTTHTTFYQYFRSKAELVSELGQDVMPHLLQLAADLDAALTRPDRAAVRSWLDAYAALWGEYLVVFEAHWESLEERRTLEGTLPLAHAMSARMTQLLARFPEAMQADVTVRMALLFVYVSQTMVIYYSGGSPGDPAMLEGLADFLWNSLSLWIEGRGISAGVLK